MHIIIDDIQVFDVLKEAGLDDFNPARSFVTDFVLRENWHLLLFNHSGESKGFRLYILENASFEIELEKILLPELLSLDESSNNLFLKNESLRIVEFFISRRNSTRLFFDAH